MLYPAQCKQIRTHWLHRDYIHDMVHVPKKVYGIEMDAERGLRYKYNSLLNIKRTN